MNRNSECTSISAHQSLLEALALNRRGVVSFSGAGGKTSLMFRLARELSKEGGPVLTTTTTKIRMPTPDQSPGVIYSVSSEELLSKARNIFQIHRHFSAGAQISSNKKVLGFPPDFVDELWYSGMFRWILVEADGAAGRSIKVPGPDEPVIPACSNIVIGVLGLDAIGKPLDNRSVFRPRLFSTITGLVMGEPLTESVVATAILHKEGIMKGAPPHADRLLFLNKADQPGALESARRISAHLLKRAEKIGLKRVIIGHAEHEPPVVECHST
ncbi:MAG TPA: putative selenium-dependent hydroxylase accessory protein YqeC [Desulfobacterales bacterium]|nr:putative selenium-dependent hydroxylase accessory protein YqeC [Desulfobacterales bacterium]